jgi:hypothetical protein
VGTPTPWATFTVATHLTADRLPALARLCTRWPGPLSAALHWDPVRDGDAGALRARVTLAVRGGACALSVHVVADSHPVVQLNLWRNVARYYAATPYVLTLDVDMLPDPGLWAALDGARDRWVSWLQQGRVLVVPAFEAVGDRGDDDDAGDSYPATQAELLARWDAGAVRMFHADWHHGHGHTNYTHWRTAAAPYRPRTYHFKWEPYVVVGPDAAWCDEGFVGYGSNKCACTVELWMAGAEFWVLPHHFLMHQPHPPPAPAADTITHADPAAAAAAAERRRARENEANVHTLRRYLDVLAVRYRRRPPLVPGDPGAAVAMADGSPWPADADATPTVAPVHKV